MRYIVYALLKLRAVVWWFLALAVAIGVAVYALLYSPEALRAVIDRVMKQASLHYRSFQGNLLEGVRLEGITFQDKMLARSIRIGIDPLALLQKKVAFSTLQIDGVKLQTLLRYLETVQHESSAPKHSGRSDALPPVQIEARHLAVRLEDDSFGGVSWDRITLRAKRLSIGSETLKAHKAKLSVQNLNYDTITIPKGHIAIAHGEYDLQKNTIGDVVFDILLQSNLFVLEGYGFVKNDTLTLQSLSLDHFDLNSTLSALKGIKTDDTAQNKNQFAIKRIRIENAHISAFAKQFYQVSLKHLNATLKDTIYDLKGVRFEQGRFELSSQSDHGDIFLEGNVSDLSSAIEGSLRIKQALFDRFDLALNASSFDPIALKGRVDLETLALDLRTKAKDLWKIGDQNGTLTAKKLHTKLVYAWKQDKIDIRSEGVFKAPYIESVGITNRFFYTPNGWHYEGEALPKVDANLSDLAKGVTDNLRIIYRGDANALEANLTSKQIDAQLNLAQYRYAKGSLRLKNIPLKQWVDLPAELREARITTALMQGAIDLKDATSMDATLSLHSNLFDLPKLKANYAKEKLRINATAHIAKNSLLDPWMTHIKPKALFPLKIQALIDKHKIDSTLQSKHLRIDAHYSLQDKSAKALIDLLGAHAKIARKPSGELVVHLPKQTVQKWYKGASAIIRLPKELEKIRGDIAIDIDQDNTNTWHMTLRSDRIGYQQSAKKETSLRNLSVLIRYQKGIILIDRYGMEIENRRFFATKPSRIVLTPPTLQIQPLIVNDALRLQGSYDLETQSGAFDLKGDRFEVREKGVLLVVRPNITIELANDQTMIKGEVGILGGKVQIAKIDTTQGGEDSDIIFVTKGDAHGQSDGMKRIAMQIFVKTYRPVTLIDRGVHLKLSPELSIFKDYHKKIEYVGSVTLQPGGIYRFKDKRFTTKQSYIYFVGDIDKPQLDIKATYQALDYLVTISVTGTPTAPELNFRSSPPLKEEQILSLLLFGTVGEGDTYSGEEMMRMMGGAVAKAALADVGVKLDHLVFGEGGSIEVGKKIGKKTTIIYIDGEVPKIKLKHRHGPRTESVISADERSQSIDIIYKRDVKRLRDTFKR